MDEKIIYITPKNILKLYNCIFLFLILSIGFFISYLLDLYLMKIFLEK